MHIPGNLQGRHRRCFFGRDLGYDLLSGLTDNVIPYRNANPGRDIGENAAFSFGGIRANVQGGFVPNDVVKGRL
jgi:hypothetical protein